jgi:lambda family phage tail tape measure protein
MADLDISVGFNSSSATRGLDDIQKRVDKLNKSFGDLKNAIGGIAIAGVISNTLRFADALSDLSDSTGIAVQNLLGFQQAIVASGGDAQNAEQGILKFVNSIGEAANGSAQAQNAFAEVGVSLQDLASLSEQELLAKTVAGLAKVGDASARARIQTDLFGKALRGVNIQNVAEQYSQATNESMRYATAIKKAGETQDNLDKLIGVFRNELLVALQPLSDFSKMIMDNVESIKKWLTIIFEVGKAVAVFFIVGKAVQFALAAILLLPRAVGLITTGFASLKKTLDLFIWQMGLVQKTGKFNEKTLAGLEKRFGFLKEGIATVAKGFAILATAAYAAYVAVKEFFGLNAEDTSSNDAETKKLQRQQDEAQKTAAAQREITDAYDKQKKALGELVNTYRTNNELALKRLKFENDLIGKSDDVVEVERAKQQVLENQRGILADLAKQQRDLKDSSGKWIDSGAEARFNQIGQYMAQITSETDKTIAATTQLVVQGQSLRLIEKDRLNNLELMTQAFERQRDIAGTTSGVYSELQKKIGDIQFGGQQRKQTDPMEQRRQELIRNITQLEADFSGKIMSAFETEDGYRNIEQMNIELAKLYKLTNALKEAQLADLDVSRQWSTGWTEAFTKYVDSATNAAQQAGEMFNAVTSNMNSAIDNFVENGKGSFSDLAKSIIKDLVKIELKAAASKVLSTAGSFFTSILGFADGGNPPINKPSIVGENGPELFVPRTAGTIIPNGGGNNTSGAGGNTYITNNITAVDAKSVAQLFAENRKTLFGTVEMARKEMSYSR